MRSLFFFILPLFLLHEAFGEGVDRFYLGHRSLKNHYRWFHNPQGDLTQPLVIITGLEDLPENWLEVQHRAVQKGYRSIAIIELRGQGRSQRVLKDRRRLLHVDQFDDYIRDLLLAFTAVQNELTPEAKAPHVIAHSTGATVLLLALPELARKLPKMNPERISLWTPLIQPKVSKWVDNGWVRAFLSPAASLSVRLGSPILARKFKLQRPEENHLTSDLKKFALQDRIRRELGLDSFGITLHWAIESFAAAEKVRSLERNLIQQPTLVLLAQHEEIVSNQWSLQNPLIVTQTVANAQHALHLETDEVLDRAFDTTFRFFNPEQDSERESSQKK